MKLVASLIVRNELGRYLEPCIAHLLEFCDEIRVLDDGSTDGSGDWLTFATGSRVFCERSSESTFFTHEGAARNELLRWTLEGCPTHVLAVDADEFVTDGQQIRAACEAGHEIVALSMLEVWKAFDECLCVRFDGGWRPHPVPAVWRVPARVDDAWAIADRPLACGRVPAPVDRQAVVGRAHQLDAAILHFGWANTLERAARHERYAVADGGRYHQSQHLQSILYDDPHVAMTSHPWPDALEPVRAQILDHAAGVVA